MVLFFAFSFLQLLGFVLPWILFWTYKFFFGMLDIQCVQPITQLQLEREPPLIYE